MNSKKSTFQVHTFILGAINGLIYGVASFQVFRVSTAYLYKQHLEVAERIDMTPVQVTYNHLNWPVIISWLVILFSVTCYLLHRYRPSYLKSTVMLWLAIGVASVGAWNLIQLALACLERWSTEQDFIIRERNSFMNPQFGPLSLIVVLVINLIYGTLIQLFSSSSYSRQEKRSERLL